MADQSSTGERMFHEIKTLEQGQNYILEVIGQIETVRARCDELHRNMLGSLGVSRGMLEKSYRELSVRYGQGLGALAALMHCRVLNDEAYNELRSRIDMAMLPKVTGEVSG